MSGGGFGPPDGGGFGPPGGGGGFGSPPGGGGGFGPPGGGAPGGGPGAFGPAGGAPPGGGGLAPPGGGGGAGPLSRIPFTPEEESNIGGAGKFMLFAGVMSIVTALVTLVKTGVALWAAPALDPGTIAGAVCGNVISMVFAGIFGVWLIVGSKALRKVVDTDEDDQLHLMQAIQKLRQVFALKAALILFAVVLVCVFGVIGGVAAAGMR